jgi:hypothetical protein
MHGLYRLLGRTFPFAIYYDVNPDAVEVTAVLDCRRDPKRIKRRLTER